MNIKIVQDNSRTERNVSDNVVETIYQEVKEYETHDVSKLVGSIEINRGYKDAVEFLNRNYSNLAISTKFEPYIRFEDSVMEQLLLNRFSTLDTPVGDGIGITQSDLNTINQHWFWDFVSHNTEITKFNELALCINYKNFGSTGFKDCTNLEEIDLTNIEIISAGGFLQNTKIKQVNLPNLTKISAGSIFNNCTSLESFNAPLLEEITNGNPAHFYNCTSLKTINIPKYNGRIHEEMFRNCTSLETLNIGNIIEIYTGGFRNCPKLTSIDLSECTKIIGDYAFISCSSLTTLGDTSNITYLSGSYIFYDCSSLRGVLDLSNVSNNFSLVGTFCNCSNLTKIKLGITNSIGGRWHTFDNGRKAFYGCTNLVTIDIKQLNFTASEYKAAFGNNTALRNFIIRNTESIPEINSEATSVNINCFGGSNVKVYVDDNLLETYKTTEGWEAMVDYLYPISEFVES